MIQFYKKNITKKFVKLLLGLGLSFTINLIFINLTKIKSNIHIYPFLLRFLNGLFCLQHNKAIPIPIHDISNKQQAISMYKIVVLLMPLFPSIN